MLRDQVLGKSLVTMIAVAALSAGCSSDGQNSIQGGEAPDMVTDVNAVVFTEVAVDSTDTQTLTLFNVGKGDLKISSVELVEDTLDDSGAEFEKGENWIGAANLSTDDVLRITVKYTPRDKDADSGYLRIETNDPKYPDGIAKIPLNTPALAPRIFSKENVIFRRVPPVTTETRDTYWQLTEVQNIGQASLTLTDMIVTPQESDFHVSFPESMDINADPATDGDSYPDKLEPGESFPVRVYFNPLDDLPSSAEMILYSNDPASSEYVVNLLGNSGSPCIQLSEEEEINFGEGAIGFANNKSIVVENCSPTSELKISAIDVCTNNASGDCDAAIPTFSLKEDSLPDGLDAGEAILAPQETTSFVVTYTPEDLSVSNGNLFMASDDPAKGMLNVPIVGKGTDNACPLAVAKAAVSGSNRYETDLQTIPLKTVTLSASDSVDSDGSVASYEWNILQQPTGSTTRLSSATAENPSLFLDLAGDYVVELKVYDDRGTQNCGDQAIINISAIPGEAISVQLVWDTPADADQTDYDGTDLDLHFLHPLGSWNSAPYDCFYLNDEADWGLAGDSTDNPSLDIDDTDGAGPENINLDNPEPSLTYSVGVYYYRASIGFSFNDTPSYATVRIFIDGQQTFEQEQLLTETDEFWHVADITNRVPTAVGTVRYDFP